MIGRRVCNVVERFADNGDDVLLANFERVRGFDTERKLLRRPAKHCLPNLTPLWANGNFGAHSSNVFGGILRRNFSQPTGADAIARDFNSLYIIDLKGNVRKDSMRDGIPIGEPHTVFGDRKRP